MISAANSLSDIYAMGAKPLIALNVVGYPIRKYRLDELYKILEGGAYKAKEANCIIAGGHTIDDNEPKYGLAVVGLVNINEILRKDKAEDNEIIVLTKKIGTGILSTGLKNGAFKEDDIKEAIFSMTTLNDKVSKVAVKLNLKCATDVTGYGLLGHLFEICEQSNVFAELDFNKIPFFDGVEDLAGKGLIPGGSKANLNFIKENLEFTQNISTKELLMCADAQTSGGLLLSVPQEKIEALKEEFKKNSLFFREIGMFKKGKPKIILKK